MEYVKTINFKLLNFCKVFELKFLKIQNGLKFITASFSVFLLFISIGIKVDEMNTYEMDVIAAVYFIVFGLFVLKFLFVYYIMSATRVIRSFEKNIIPIFFSNPFELFFHVVVFLTIQCESFFDIFIVPIVGVCAFTLYPYFFVCYMTRRLKLLSKNRTWKFWVCKIIKIFTFFIGLIGPFAFMCISFWFYGIDFENKYYLCLLFIPYFGILKQVIAAIYFKNLRLIPSNKKSIDAFIFSNSLKNDIKLYFIFYVLFILFSNMKG